MNLLITEANNLLKNQGFDYAFCGGHALDIHCGRKTRPHGDLDISAFGEDRNKIILFMQSQGWTVYEAMGGALVHLISKIDNQMLIKLNIFCVKEKCQFFHNEPQGDGIYCCVIEHTEQKTLDFIEFLFNRRNDTYFLYSRNRDIRLELDKAILKKDGISYLAPELVLLYKSTDLLRDENRQDFETAMLYLSNESRVWLKNALLTAFPAGHEWMERI